MKAAALKKVVSLGLDRVWGDKSHSMVAPVFFGPGRGLKLKFKLLPHGEFEFVLGQYERKIAKRLQEHCIPGSVVWECGSHIGYFTSLIAKLVGPTGKVVVFEPDPTNRNRTQENLALNELTNTKMLPVAVGADQKEVRFLSNVGAVSRLENCYVGSQVGATFGGDLVVESVSLDKVFQSGKYPRPTILKMDIEGGELFALPHAMKMLSECRPVVFIESHNPETDKMIFETFSSLNYTLEQISAGKMATKAEEVCAQMLALPR